MDEHTNTNYVLIDFENVQPTNLTLLLDRIFRVYVFIGENQTKIPFAVVEAMQQLGDAGKYVKISGNGPNALDFHIAYYLGELCRCDPAAYFHVISKDTGFDPLIRHLRQRSLHVHREKDLAEIPLLRVSASGESVDKIDLIARNLAGRGASRPRKLATLANTINSIFNPKLDELEMALVINELKERGYIMVAEENISYRLPKFS